MEVELETEAATRGTELPVLPTTELLEMLALRLTSHWVALSIFISFVALAPA
jgi:hypothetical protein